MYKKHEIDAMETARLKSTDWVFSRIGKRNGNNDASQWILSAAHSITEKDLFLSSSASETNNLDIKKNATKNI